MTFQPIRKSTSTKHKRIQYTTMKLTRLFYKFNALNNNFKIQTPLKPSAKLSYSIFQTLLIVKLQLKNIKTVNSQKRRKSKPSRTSPNLSSASITQSSRSNTKI